VERRLAAIVSIDVVGYSRLIETDEAATLEALRSHRAELIDPKIEQYGGRIVKTMGDGLLLEFPSVVNAVRCAIEAQEGMAERNEKLPDSDRIVFRVGINLGDIVIDGEDIHGNGVNVAARLEAMSSAGGIAVSAIAYESLGRLVDAAFEDAGEHTLKNISRPVQVWRWAPDASDLKKINAINAPLPLPEKPSIAVLPFENMSGDPEQEYFSDGIAEDIITELSKFRWFFVTARNSTFTYKGSAVDIKRVGRVLGVRFVLEGSVRKAGNRVRVSAQLIEAATGNHIWAERYDRHMEDIFDLQDEITRTIAAAVEPELASFERQTALRKPTSNLDAWDLYQRGVAKMWLTNISSFEESRQLMAQAIAIDPEFGRAHSYRALDNYFLIMFGSGDDRDKLLDDGIADAKKAIAIDSRDYFGHFSLGKLLILACNLDGAIRSMETSLKINPNFAHGYYGIATAYYYADEASKALEFMDLMIRLSPNDPLMWAALTYKGVALYDLGDVTGAISTLEHACQFPSAHFHAFVWLAAMYQKTGRSSAAVETLAEAKRFEPKLSATFLDNLFPFRKSGGMDRMIDELRKVGLEE
jgi:adenylate cyclase